MAHKVFTQELSFGELLTESINIIKDKFKILTVFSLVFVLPSSLYTALNPISKNDVTINFPVLFISLILTLISFISLIGIIKIIEDSILEENKSFKEYLIFSLKRYFPLIISLIIFGFAITLFTFSIMLIFALVSLNSYLPMSAIVIIAMLPTILAFIFLSVVFYAVILKNISSPFKAFNYSYNLIKGNVTKVFSSIFVVMLSSLLINVILYYASLGFTFQTVSNSTVSIYQILAKFITILGIYPGILLYAFIVLLMINLEAMKGYYEEIDEDNNDLENLTTNNN